MYHYEYVTKGTANEQKKEVVRIINEVQDEVRKEFTFQYFFIGSSSRNMITFDKTTNTGYDFDVDIVVNPSSGELSPKEIRGTLERAFQKISKKYGYNAFENSSRVFTIKALNPSRNKIEHSCDIAIVNKHANDNKNRKYIAFEKQGNSYCWEESSKPYEVEGKAECLRKSGRWGEVRKAYLKKKNENTDSRKHSRALYAETINEVYAKYTTSNTQGFGPGYEGAPCSGYAVLKPMSSNCIGKQR